VATIVVPSKPKEEFEKPPKSVCLQDLSRLRQETEMEMIGMRVNNGTQQR
jgi:hypothetical protein